jgi:hypothetical protein
MTEKEENWKEKKGKKGSERQNKQTNRGVSYDNWKEIFSETLNSCTRFSYGI